MKNILLLAVSLGIFYSLQAQENSIISDKYGQFIIDTVNSAHLDKFYLVDASKSSEFISSGVRSMENGLAIVKGSELKNDGGEKGYLLLNNSWKLSSSIANGGVTESKKAAFSLKYLQGTNLDFIYENKRIDVVRDLKKAQIILVRSKFELIKKEIIANPGIVYIDVANRIPKEESPIRQFNPDINRINKAKHNYPELNGENLTISLKENSISEDIDLVGKVTLDENSSEEFTQHAKEMGTLIAGRGNSFKTGEGVVTKASIVCTDFSSLFAEEASYYNRYGISAQNHSYGTGIENFYGNESVSYDQISVDIPELVHLFSAGNAGNMAPEAGTYADLPGFANLTGDFKQSKNVIVIAAVDSTINHESLTSSGPAYDGRIKPELAAFGGEGTSESAAIATGSVAKLQNHYFNKNGNLPISSMIKSLLIAGANEAHTPGIDFRTGYGSINLNKSLQLIDSGWYQAETLNSNEQKTLLIEVPENSAELKVVLSWIDPPANPEDVIALVNDLDMTITAPDNTTWLPWILDASPNSSTLVLPATRGEDHLNNVEMISIENPRTGTYAVDISASQIQGIGQFFSMAYHIKPMEHFEWSYPTSSDHLEAATKPFFRWENTYDAQNADLSIKYGEGDWELISQVDVSEEQFPYSLKGTTSFALLKMDVAGVEYLSDTFTISKLPEINVENDCSSEFILSWEKQKNTDSYKLFELQSNELVSVETTADTLVKLDKSVFNGNYYAVRPIHSEMLDGLRSFSVNYENRNKGCYLTNFLTFLDLDGFVRVQLSINVPFEISQVSITKEFDGALEVFQQFSPGSIKDFDFEDHDLKPGKYIYQVHLTLTSGGVISSDAQSLFYTDSATVVAFPNPVINDDFVNILNDFSGGLLQLIDDKGNFVKDFDLVNNVEELDLTGINKGIYFFRILHEGSVVNSGRIVRL